MLNIIVAGRLGALGEAVVEELIAIVDVAPAATQSETLVLESRSRG
ncbi:MULTISPECIES: hypothetical protein [Sphingobium]|nr:MULTISPECIES: hypothetical protein [Sphingobium]